MNMAINALRGLQQAAPTHAPFGSIAPRFQGAHQTTEAQKATVAANLFQAQPYNLLNPRLADHQARRLDFNA
jgi:hypothetical protein